MLRTLGFFASILAAQPAADALFEQARAAQLGGRPDEAEAAYRKYIRTFKPRAEVLANLGVLLAKREDYGEAIRHYRHALRIDPSLAPLHLNLGLSHLKQGQPAAAVRELDIFLRASPGHLQAMQLKAVALFEMEDYPGAEAQYRALPASSDISVPLGLATSLLRQGKAAEARAVIEPVLTRDDSPELQLTLGQMSLHEGRLKEALAAFERARALNPALPGLRLNLGAVYWRQRRTADAIAEWRAEYAARPSSFDAAYALGSALALNTDSEEEALGFLRQAVGLKPLNARASYQLAKLIWQRSRDREAVALLQRATQAEPGFRQAFHLLGMVLQSLGRKTEAARAFARVKEITAKDMDRQRDLFEEAR